MLTPIERKRKEVEIQRVLAAKADLELKIFEREDEIQRLKENIKGQDARVEELKAELAL